MFIKGLKTTPNILLARPLPGIKAIFIRPDYLIIKNVIPTILESECCKI